MDNRTLDFVPKTYFFREDYEKDGCPVLYYEFHKHAYYGLIATKTDLKGLSVAERASKKAGANRAIQIYFETIGGESLEQIKQEGYPKQISRHEALLKFLLAPNTRNKSVDELVSEFERIEDSVLLVDGCLV